MTRNPKAALTTDGLAYTYMVILWFEYLSYHKVCNENGVRDSNVLWIDGTWYCDAVGVSHDEFKNSINKYTKINQNASIWIIEKSKGPNIQVFFLS